MSLISFGKNDIGCSSSAFRTGRRRVVFTTGTIKGAFVVDAGDRELKSCPYFFFKAALSSLVLVKNLSTAASTVANFEGL